MEARLNFAGYLMRHLTEKYNISSFGFSSDEKSSYEMIFSKELCRNPPRCRQEIFLEIGDFLGANKVHYKYQSFKAESKIEFQSSMERYLIDVFLDDLVTIKLAKLEPIKVEIND